MRVIVADSSRLGIRGAATDLDVMNVAAPSRKPAVIAHIGAGLLPREVARVATAARC